MQGSASGSVRGVVPGCGVLRKVSSPSVTSGRSIICVSTETTSPANRSATSSETFRRSWTTRSGISAPGMITMVIGKWGLPS